MKPRALILLLLLTCFVPVQTKAKSTKYTPPSQDHVLLDGCLTMASAVETRMREQIEDQVFIQAYMSTIVSMCYDKHTRTKAIEILTRDLTDLQNND